MVNSQEPMRLEQVKLLGGPQMMVMHWQRDVMGSKLYINGVEVFKASNFDVRRQILTWGVKLG